jgi:type IV secretion system protein VirB4
MQDSIDIGTPFHDGMKKWTAGGRYSGWFNAARDTLDFSAGQLFGFEMAQALKEPEGAAALIEYITYRIRQHCTKAGLKHVIFCDEAARLFQDKTFAANAKAWFRESRKLDGVIGVAFQEPGALAELGIQDTIWDNCSTFFLFPNRQARRDDYAAFQLTEPQWAYVSGNHDYVNQRGLTRTCLLIRPTRRESVILDINLNRLGPLVRCFRSGTEANAALTTYRTEHGRSPTWQEDYLGV